MAYSNIMDSLAGLVGTESGYLFHDLQIYYDGERCSCYQVDTKQYPKQQIFPGYLIRW